MPKTVPVLHLISAQLCVKSSPPLNNYFTFYYAVDLCGSNNFLFDQCSLSLPGLSSWVGSHIFFFCHFLNNETVQCEMFTAAFRILTPCFNLFHN